MIWKIFGCATAGIWIGVAISRFVEGDRDGAEMALALGFIFAISVKVGI